MSISESHAYRRGKVVVVVDGVVVVVVAITKIIKVAWSLAHQ